ncbi:MAG: GntR family transcriptional regulator [Burkholderiaceae bacterium]
MTQHTSRSIKVERNNKTLRELTLEKMRDAILSGYFSPGQRLVERTLCEELDVSRSIVREVLRHLETEGLVERHGTSGPAVAKLTADKARQIFEIRSLLEGHAARLCAMQADSSTVNRLSEINQNIQQAFAQENYQRVLTHTTAFYEALFQGCGMTLAWDIVKSLNARINLLRAVTIGAAGRRADAAREMEAIIHAIRQGDADAAEQASKDHVTTVASIALAKLQG